MERISIPRAVINTVLHSATIIKSIVLLIIVLACSCVYTLELYQSDYFGNKSNILNKHFVKLGWGWTLGSILPVMTITVILYTGLQFMMMIRHFARLLVGHLIWYGMTTLFVQDAKILGSCSNHHFTTEFQCVEQGEQWIGFDISGHTFLLTYCILLLTEECQLIRPNIWILYKGYFSNGERFVNKLEDSKKGFLLRFYNITTPAVRILEVLLFIEVLLMGVMLIATQMYYHTFAEKITGYFFAIVCWGTTYGLFYGKWCWGPCAVNEGILNPLSNNLT